MSADHNGNRTEGDMPELDQDPFPGNLRGCRLDWMGILVHCGMTSKTDPQQIRNVITTAAPKQQQFPEISYHLALLHLWGILEADS
jgi:hypothetical protein